jgi:biopolymer transport protein ExbD/biopolymer transport protein TolR
MAIGSRNKNEGFSEINITPLTDIFLVLLIIMMVVAPTFQNINQNIEIPEINSGLNVEHKDIEVSITKEGEMFVNKVPTPQENLVSALVTIKEQIQEKSVVVRADKETKNKDVLAVMKAAREAGFEKLTIAGEPLSKKQQKELTTEAPVSQNNSDTTDRSKVNVPQ